MVDKHVFFYSGYFSPFFFIALLGVETGWISTESVSRKWWKLSFSSVCTVTHSRESWRQRRGCLTMPPASNWILGGKSPRSNQQSFPGVGWGLSMWDCSCSKDTSLTTTQKQPWWCEEAVRQSADPMGNFAPGTHTLMTKWPETLLVLTEALWRSASQEGFLVGQGFS